MLQISRGIEPPLTASSQVFPRSGYLEIETVRTVIDLPSHRIILIQVDSVIFN